MLQSPSQSLVHNQGLAMRLGMLGHNVLCKQLGGCYSCTMFECVGVKASCLCIALQQHSTIADNQYCFVIAIPTSAVMSSRFIAEFCANLYRTENNINRHRTALTHKHTQLKQRTAPAPPKLPGLLHGHQQHALKELSIPQCLVHACWCMRNLVMYHQSCGMCVH